MKMKSGRIMILGLALALTMSLSARPAQEKEHHPSSKQKNSVKKPVKLMGAIYLPGNPLRFDLSLIHI